MVKGNYEKLTGNILLNEERLKSFPEDQERDKDAHFHHHYSSLYWKF